MRHAITFILVSLAACIIGIGSAWFALQGDLKFQKTEIGQWDIWPKAADPSADPYTKAYLARAGKTWMSTTEGLAFFSSEDSRGEQYASNCEYKLTGIIPRGRLWTLTYLETGKSNNSTQPAYITSEDVIWSEDEQLEIYISKTAQPGNWLPLNSRKRFSLILRIYDTPLTSDALDAAIKTPLIERVNCI
ncbi:MAG: DUF1214 domain-containing protein [Hyphomicrobiales bacterium]